MALFKIEKGLAANLTKNRPNAKEGYAYFTTDDGKLYIDISGKGTEDTPANDKTRIAVNAKKADYATYDENGRNLAELSEVSYENIDDNGSKIGTININGINYSVTCPADIASKPVNKYVFTAKANQNTFTIPFDFDNSSALTLYYNGIMLKEMDHYTIKGKVITLNGWTSEANDYLTVMGIEGAAAINVDEKVAQTQQAIDNAEITINNKVSSAIKQIDNKLATVPDDIKQAIYKNRSNIMTANGRITMDSSYVPTTDMDLVTKRYVDTATPPAVGTTTDYSIYIGSTQPASGTAPLVWIDTTAKTGTFKYRTSTTGTWTPVPVA